MRGQLNESHRARGLTGDQFQLNSPQSANKSAFPKSVLTKGDKHFETLIPETTLSPMAQVGQQGRKMDVG